MSVEQAKNILAVPVSKSMQAIKKIKLWQVVMSTIIMVSKNRDGLLKMHFKHSINLSKLGCKYLIIRYLILSFVDLRLFSSLSIQEIFMTEIAGGILTLLFLISRPCR